jgi:hypothetical protein
MDRTIADIGIPDLAKGTQIGGSIQRAAPKTNIAVLWTLLYISFLNSAL